MTTPSTHAAAAEVTVIDRHARWPLLLLLGAAISWLVVSGVLALIAAISAPTSLAVEFARANNQTLVGFLRGETMNIYAGGERITR